MTTNSKAELLERLLADLGDEKVIVFTEYRATQQYLRWRLEKAGFSTLGFDGSVSASRKEWIRELFRRQAQVLVSTEAGGEGINFQFCCHVVNYDLPWNPMRLEQRIGRVHRLGQTRDVSIYNFATRGTVEEDVLYLLYDKINMFEMVLGELDVILSKLKLGGSFERSRGDLGRFHHAGRNQGAPRSAGSKHPGDLGGRRRQRAGSPVAMVMLTVARCPRIQKSADDVAEFVLTYFDLLGASIEEAAPGLYRVGAGRGARRRAGRRRDACLDVELLAPSSRPRHLLLHFFAGSGRKTP